MALSYYYYDPFYEPFYSISDVDRYFNTNRTTDRDLTRVTDNDRGLIRPKMDLFNDSVSDMMTATFELPGLTRENVNVDVINNKLVVTGSVENITGVDDAGYALRERNYGRFSRTIPLPTGTTYDEIDARVANGVLTVRFPQRRGTEDRIIVY